MEIPLGSEIDTNKVHDWRVSLRPVRHMTIFSSTWHIPQKRIKSLQLTIALYYHPIVLSITTKHNFIPFFVWSPNWENVAKCCNSFGTFSHGIALLWNSLDVPHVWLQCVQVPQLPVLLLRPTDEQEQLADLTPHEWRLLGHHVLGFIKVERMDS